MQDPNAGPTLKWILDDFYMAIITLYLIPKAVDIAFQLWRMLRDVVKCNDSTFADERGVHRKVGPHSFVSVVAVNEQKIQFFASK